MNNVAAFIAEDIRADRAAGDIGSLLSLFRYAKTERRSYVLGLLLLGLSAGLVLIGAYALGRFIKAGIEADDIRRAVLFAALVVGSETGGSLLSYLGRKILAKASGLTILNIREALCSRLQALPMSYFDRQPLGRTVTRVSHDVESLEDFFSGSMARMIILSLTALFSLFAMALTDPALSLICFGAMIPVVVLTQGSRGRSRELNRRISVANSAANSRLSEYINGIQVIRSFGLEDWSLSKFRDSVRETIESNIRTNEFYCWLRPTTEFLVHLPLLCILYFGSARLQLGYLDIASFIAFLRYADRFSRPMSELSREIHMIQQAFTSAERLCVFLNSPTEDSELGPDGDIRLEKLEGKIKYLNVDMEYNPGQKVLKSITFEADPGEKLGLVGATGSGKTTTVSLLSRLYEFQGGSIEIDGVDIRRFSRGALRRKVGFISQDAIIFKGTLRENLDDSGKLTDAEIKTACRETGLFEILKRRGLDLDDIILDKGANLSVGERQLLAVTRIMLKAPQILVMDEATANIDPELEQIIHDAVDRLMRGRTTLIIAHRLSTLRDCSRLLVFQDGGIIEAGTHGELLAAGGAYAELVKKGEFAA